MFEPDPTSRNQVSETGIGERTFLHLLGKTGTGKSSTGNTILGKKVFCAKSSLSAVTKVIQEEEGPGLLKKQTVVVVDGPGLVGVNTGVSDEAVGMFRQVIERNQESRHVFLIVCRYGERFTEEDEEMVKRLKAEFGGRRVFRNHAVVILTCGDNFERDTEDEGLTFQQWCDNQTGAFDDLRKSCGLRVLSVDNRKKGVQKENPFLKLLEEKINEIPCGYEEMRGTNLISPTEIDVPSSSYIKAYNYVSSFFSYFWNFFSENEANTSV